MPSSTPIYSIITATSHHTGTDPAEQVQANLTVNRNGGDTAAGDLDVDYLAPIDLAVRCGQPLGLLVSAAAGRWRQRHAQMASTVHVAEQGDSDDNLPCAIRGGRTTLTTWIDGVDTAPVTPVLQAREMWPELALAASVPATATTGSTVNRRRR